MSDTMRSIPEGTTGRAHVDNVGYLVRYRASVENPEAFWAEEGKRLDWITPYRKIKNTTFAYPDVSIKWVRKEIGPIASPISCSSRLACRRHTPARSCAEPPGKIAENDFDALGDTSTLANPGVVDELVAELGNR